VMAGAKPSTLSPKAQILEWRAVLRHLAYALTIIATSMPAALFAAARVGSTVPHFLAEDAPAVAAFARVAAVVWRAVAAANRLVAGLVVTIVASAADESAVACPSGADARRFADAECWQAGSRWDAADEQPDVPVG